MSAPIAIFDSGVGGLTVMKHIASALPNESIIYLGDTARIPYGTKSGQAIVNFARQNTNFLLEFSPKMIVVACNTASAVALSTLRDDFSNPFCGVLTPGCRRAVAVTRTKRIGIIATETTIGSRAYENTIRELDSDVECFSRACPLFVPLVEEGRGCMDEIVRRVVAEYLADLTKKDIDTLILGCTHYPILKDAIAEFMGEDVCLVDSATETAKEAKEILENLELLRDSDEEPIRRFFVTDHPRRFAAIGQRFLNHAISSVDLVSPEEFFISAHADEVTGLPAESSVLPR